MELAEPGLGSEEMVPRSREPGGAWEALSRLTDHTIPPSATHQYPVGSASPGGRGLMPSSFYEGSDPAQEVLHGSLTPSLLSNCFSPRILQGPVQVLTFFAE